jgi:hypothetical protein
MKINSSSLYCFDGGNKVFCEIINIIGKSLTLFAHFFGANQITDPRLIL